MATHSSVLAWRIPGTGEPGGLPSLGSHRVGHDWSDLAAAAAAAAAYLLHSRGTKETKKPSCLRKFSRNKEKKVNEITTSMTWRHIFNWLTELKYREKVRTWERQEPSYCDPEEVIWAINLEKWREIPAPVVRLHASAVFPSQSQSEQTYYLWCLMPFSSSWLDWVFLILL